jgi:hypothetical protein
MNGIIGLFVVVGVSLFGIVWICVPFVLLRINANLKKQLAVLELIHYELLRNERTR